MSKHTHLDKRTALHAHVRLEQRPDRRRDLEQPLVEGSKEKHDRRDAGAPRLGIGGYHALVHGGLAVDGAFPDGDRVEKYRMVSRTSLR